MTSANKMRALAGVLFASGLALSALAVSADKAFAEKPDYAVSISASDAVADDTGKAKVRYDVSNDGNRDLVDCHVVGGASRDKLEPGDSFGGNLTLPVGEKEIRVTCYENNGHKQSVKDSVTVTVSEAAAVVPNKGVSAHTGDESGLPVGGIVGLAGMLVAGVGTALRLYRKH